jgi:hypothetical protein
MLERLRVSSRIIQREDATHAEETEPKRRRLHGPKSETEKVEAPCVERPHGADRKAGQTWWKNLLAVSGHGGTSTKQTVGVVDEDWACQSHG